MMETPEGFVPQEQHDQAMLTLRAELSEAINAKQAEIDNIKAQSLDMQSSYQTQILELQADRDKHKSDADSAKNDNQMLRKSLSDYLMSTDGGKAVLKDFSIWLLQSQLEAINKKLAELMA